MIGRNMSNVNAAGNYPRPTPGGYVMRIETVNNNVKKEQLEVCLEFTVGEIKDYCKDIKDRFGFWPARCNKSYKEKALPFFKAFIEAVLESNGSVYTDGLVIGDFEDVDETKLIGKLVGVVVGEREYDGNDGTRKKALDWYNADFVTAEDIKNGNYTVPELRVTGSKATVTPSADVVDYSASYGPINEDDVPF